MNSNRKLCYRYKTPQIPGPLGNSTKRSHRRAEQRIPHPAWQFHQEPAHVRKSSPPLGDSSSHSTQRNEIPRTPLVDSAKSPLICGQPNPPAW